MKFCLHKNTQLFYFKKDELPIKTKNAKFIKIWDKHTYLAHYSKWNSLNKNMKSNKRDTDQFFDSMLTSGYAKFIDLTSECNADECRISRDEENSILLFSDLKNIICYTTNFESKLT